MIDGERRLVGVFTDGDLRRLVQSGNANLECAVSTVMTRHPQTVDEAMLVMEAVEVFRRHRIDQVPVVDASKIVVGLLDVQDLLGEIQEDGDAG